MREAALEQSWKAHGKARFAFRGRIRGVLPALLLVLSAVPAAAAASPVRSDSETADITNPEKARVQDADLQFREALGFSTDAGVLRAAASNEAADPSEYGGTPLTDEERDELRRRLSVQWATVPAMEYATSQAEFAGGYIDQLSGGVPVFLFTGSLDVHEASITKALHEPIEFRVAQATRSLSELLAQQSAVLADRDRLKEEGVRVVETAILPDRNAVLVGIDGLTPVDEAAVSARAGDNLIFVESKPAEADACPNGSNCRPIKGGIAVGRPNNAWPCTSGFIVKEGASLRLLTAGHCLHMAGGPTVDWFHNGVKFGDALSDTWQPTYTRTADVGLIDIDSAELAQITTDNLMHRGAGNVWPVLGQVQGHLQMMNSVVYRYGRTTGTMNGRINGLYASRDSCVGLTCMTVTKTIMVNFDSEGGDSGGPVFYYAPSPAVGVIAMGTHVHSEDEDNPALAPFYGWYSPVDVGAAQYDEFFGTYTLCTQANC